VILPAVSAAGAGVVHVGEWDLCRENGDPAASGVYWVFVSGAGVDAVEKIVVYR
jgi:hypothetical protein